MATKYALLAPEITNVINGQNVKTVGLAQMEVLPLGDASVAAFQAPAAGANPTKAEFDALVSKLIAAGLMAAS